MQCCEDHSRTGFCAGFMFGLAFGAAVAYALVPRVRNRGRLPLADTPSGISSWISAKVRGNR
jgi:hypothetical protein